MEKEQLYDFTPRSALKWGSVGLWCLCQKTNVMPWVNRQAQAMPSNDMVLSRLRRRSQPTSSSFASSPPGMAINYTRMSGYKALAKARKAACNAWYIVLSFSKSLEIVSSKSLNHSAVRDRYTLLSNRIFEIDHFKREMATSNDSANDAQGDARNGNGEGPGDHESIRSSVQGPSRSSSPCSNASDSSDGGWSPLGGDAPPTPGTVVSTAEQDATEAYELLVAGQFESELDDATTAGLFGNGTLPVTMNMVMVLQGVAGPITTCVINAANPDSGLGPFVPAHHLPSPTANESEFPPGFEFLNDYFEDDKTPPSSQATLNATDDSSSYMPTPLSSARNSPPASPSLTGD
ncbi:hypothetical protein KEM54_000723 [Ascosphaera aggregata]|nr:hypothetical protein KEM54_000723 [Ascosphaera aggregata]